MNLIPNPKTKTRSDLLKMLLLMAESEKISTACFAICSGLTGIINIIRSITMLNNGSRESTFK